MTVPEADRAGPPLAGGEREMLDGWLGYYRDSVLAKCAGLTGAQLAERSCPPSPLSLAGLARHLTEMERAWAQRISEPGLPLLYCTDASPDGDIDDVSAETAVADLRVLAAHGERSARVLGALPLDAATPAGRTVRGAYLYLMKEYARHLGHADLLRERIDGVTGE